MVSAIISVRPHFSSNKLLQSISGERGKKVASETKVVALRSKEVLYRADEKINDVFFPLTAVISHLTVMSDGHTIDSGTVGCEGATWISASSGVQSMPCQTLTAVPGDAVKMPVKILHLLAAEDPGFQDRLTRYSHALLIHCMRATACNGLHSLHQRCARWMLTTLDRVAGESFSITQEFLSELMGVGRPRITEVVSHLEGMRIVSTKRGEITVKDRAGLEKMTCECYQIIKDNFEKTELS